MMISLYFFIILWLKLKTHFKSYLFLDRMNEYLVSARKYRPKSFDDVVGQKHVTTTLHNVILNNTIAHAYLFCGPRGVGKTTCARIFAKAVNKDTDSE